MLHSLTGKEFVSNFIPRKPGRRTSAVILGIEPPDKFPLVFYRDNCADIELTIEDVRAAPIAQSHLLLISGTGLSREPSRSATIYAAERARTSGTKVVLDLDFRPALPEHPFTKRFFDFAVDGLCWAPRMKEGPAL